MLEGVLSPLSLFPLAVIVILLVYAFRKRMYLTHALLIVNVVTFAYINVLIRLPSNILSVGAFTEFYLDIVFWPLALIQGLHPASVLLSMFSHISFIHIIGNMIFLFLMGQVLEDRVGKANFFVIYIMAGVGGHILYTFLQCADLDSCRPALGASGAISGIVGALMALFPREKILMPIPLGPIFIIRRVNATLAGLIFLGFQTVYALFWGDTGVAYSAHIGGFIAGMALAPLIVARDPDIKAHPGFLREREHDYSGLEPLATSEDLKRVLEIIKNEDEPEVRQAWLEHFAGRLICQECLQRMELRGREIVCMNCGHHVKF